VAFDVTPCGAESVPQTGDDDDVAGAVAEEAPRPPATGSGSQETPKLQDWQAMQLGRLMLGIGGAVVLGVLLTRFLARVAPLQRAEKKK
jgi:hypothetical protein